MRLRAVAVALLLGTAFATQSEAANQWGGSAVISSDYFVRGISRTSDHAALQLEFHYVNPTGLFAGVFASNSQFDSHDRQDAELSAYVGYAWNIGEQWRGKLLASHYAYPWNAAGSSYNYDEFDFDISFEGWLHFIVGYSPNSWRLYRDQYGTELINVGEKSVEASLQRQLVGRFSLTAGVGYSYLSGRNSGGYAYWSGGVAYNLAPVDLTLSYVDSTPAAKPLFYNAASTGRWLGSVLWRF